MFHRKRQTVCLPFTVIRILPKDEHLRLFMRRCVQCSEDICLNRIHAMFLSFISDELLKLCKVRFG